jgi:glucose dehydrogenase
MKTTTATLAVGLTLACAGSMPARKDWEYFGQDQSGSRYSNLKQMDAANVQNLTRAWTFHTGAGDGRQYVVVAASGGGFLRDLTSDALIAFAISQRGK